MQHYAWLPAHTQIGSERLHTQITPTPTSFPLIKSIYTPKIKNNVRKWLKGTTVRSWHLPGNKEVRNQSPINAFRFSMSLQIKQYYYITIIIILVGDNGTN